MKTALKIDYSMLDQQGNTEHHRECISLIPKLISVESTEMNCYERIRSADTIKIVMSRYLKGHAILKVMSWLANDHGVLKQPSSLE